MRHLHAATAMPGRSAPVAQLSATKSDPKSNGCSAKIRGTGGRGPGTRDVPYPPPPEPPAVLLKRKGRPPSGIGLRGRMTSAICLFSPPSPPLGSIEENESFATILRTRLLGLYASTIGSTARFDLRHGSCHDASRYPTFTPRTSRVGLQGPQRSFRPAGVTPG